MPMSQFFLPLVGISVLLLLGAIYVHAFLYIRLGIPLSWPDWGMLAVQAGLLALLLRAGIGLDRAGAAAAALCLAFFAFCLTRAALQSRRRQRTLGPYSVREAIDSLPDGLCFATPDGKPILVNTKMDALVTQLTGGPLQDALTVWARLEELAQTCLPPVPWIAAPVPGQLDLAGPDGRRWRFQQELLSDQQPPYVQLTAWEETRLWQLSRQLYENNQALAGQHRRLRALLGNMVQLNREKEMFALKSRIHNEFGQCLLTTEQALASGTAATQMPALAALWRRSLRCLTTLSPPGGEQREAPEEELRRVAQLVGCHLTFRGETGLPRETMGLICAAAREALTNGVRHAGATQVTVDISPAPAGWHAEISDNGHVQIDTLTEGEGLRNLRRKLEREGAVFQVLCGDGVHLVLDLPAPPLPGP